VLQGDPLQYELLGILGKKYAPAPSQCAPSAPSPAPPSGVTLPAVTLTDEGTWGELHAELEQRITAIREGCERIVRFNLKDAKNQLHGQRQRRSSDGDERRAFLMQCEEGYSSADGHEVGCGHKERLLRFRSFAPISAAKAAAASSARERNGASSSDRRTIPVNVSRPVRSQLVRSSVLRSTAPSTRIASCGDGLPAPWPRPFPARRALEAGSALLSFEVRSTFPMGTNLPRGRAVRLASWWRVRVCFLR
jgi:hypothetical protein